MTDQDKPAKSREQLMIELEQELYRRATAGSEQIVVEDQVMEAPGYIGEVPAVEMGALLSSPTQFTPAALMCEGDIIREVIWDGDRPTAIRFWEVLAQPTIWHSVQRVFHTVLMQLKPVPEFGGHNRRLTNYVDGEGGEDVILRKLNVFTLEDN